jgi:hypothetical protein
MDAGQFQRQPVGDHPLFAAGVHEQQVFLAVLEKPEIAAGVALFRGYLEPARRGDGSHGCGDEGLNPVQRIDGDALALTQPGDQLAIVDRATAEGRFGHVRLAAEFGDLGQDLVVFHETDLGRLWAIGFCGCPTIICP